MPAHDDIEHQRKLLAISRNRLRHLLEQQERLGVEHVSFVVVDGIAEARKSIDRIKLTLRGWGEAVEDLPEDEAAPRNEPRPQSAAGRISSWRWGGILVGVGLLLVIGYASRSLWNPQLATVLPSPTTASSSALATTAAQSEVCSIPAATHTIKDYAIIYTDTDCAKAVTKEQAPKCTKEDGTLNADYIVATLNSASNHADLVSYIYSDAHVADVQDFDRDAWPVKLFVKVPDSYMIKSNGELRPQALPLTTTLVLAVPPAVQQPSYNVGFSSGAMNAQVERVCSKGGVSIISFSGYINRHNLHELVKKLP